MMLKKSLGFLLFFCGATFAQEASPTAKHIAGATELGLNFVRGNTTQNTLLLKGNIDFKPTQWENLVKYKLYSAQDNGSVTAENYHASESLRYFYKPSQFLFGQLDFSNDRFIGYSRRFSETIGYGQRFYDSDKFKLTGTASVGFRQTKKTDSNTDQVIIEKLAIDTTWQIDEQWKISENADMAIGPDARITESETALSFKTTENLFLKLSLYLQHINKVPAGKKTTDTTTALSIAYEY